MADFNSRIKKWGRWKPVTPLLVIVLLLFLGGVTSADSPEADKAELLKNGSFEEGFNQLPGVGDIGRDWTSFHNNPGTHYGFFDESWDIAVCQDDGGKHAQGMSIQNASGLDSRVGIYQVVQVVPGENYTFKMRGMIRSSGESVDASDYGHRLQIAFDYNGNTQWELIPGGDWEEVLWDEQPLVPKAGTFRMETYEKSVRATSDYMTIFLVGWKKFPDGAEVNFDIDCMSFTGMAPDGALEGTGTEAAAPVVAQDAATPTAESTEEPAASPTAEADASPTAEPTATPDVPPPTPVAPAPTDAPAEMPISGEGQTPFKNVATFIATTLMIAVLVGGAIRNVLGGKTQS